MKIMNVFHKHHKIVFAIILCVFIIFGFIFSFVLPRVMSKIDSYKHNHTLGVGVYYDVYTDGKEYIEYFDDIDKYITFNKCAVPYDSFSNTFFIPQDNNNDVFSGRIKAKGGEHLYFVSQSYNDYLHCKQAACRDGYMFELYIVSDSWYTKCNICLTALPLYNITISAGENICSGEISDYRFINDKLICNQTSAHIKENSESGSFFISPSNCSIYRLEKISDKDQSYCRTALCYAIWNSINGDIMPDVTYEFCELVVNGRYQGVFLFVTEIQKQSGGSAMSENYEISTSIDSSDASGISSADIWFTFLQFSQVAYTEKQNPYIFTDSNLNCTVPCDIQYSFGIYPDEQIALEKKAYLHILKKEDVDFSFSEDNITSLLTRTNEWCSVVDQYFQILLNAGCFARNSSIPAAEYGYSELKDYIWRRENALNEYYGNIIHSYDNPVMALKQGFNNIPLIITNIDFSEEAINLYVSGSKAYYFLPSFVRLENVQISDKIEQLPKQLDIGEEYCVQICDCQLTLMFMQSENTAAMFIDTYNESIADINAVKGFFSSGYMKCVSSDGATDSEGTFKNIHARGRSSFLDVDKKSYQFNMTKKTDILGMGAAKKWILQANALDSSYVRNKISYDFAMRIGLRYAIDSEYVDLYINGEYVGNYLVCEKVEVKSNRVDIGSSNSSYLVSFDEPDGERSFADLFGRTISVKYPEEADYAQYKLIKDSFLGAEALIFNKESDWTQLQESIDTESFALMFFVDFLINEVDKNSLSTFYYYDGSNEKLYAGPCWDCDRSLGSITGGLFPSYNLYRCGLPELLYEKDNFYFYLQQVYYEKVKPIIKNILHEIQHLKGLTSSVNMDNLLYEAIESSQSAELYSEHLASIESIIYSRFKILDALMTDKNSWVPVFIFSETGNIYWVENGSSLSQAELSFLCEYNSCVSFQTETGEMFVSGSPVTGKTILLPVTDGG